MYIMFLLHVLRFSTMRISCGTFLRESNISQTSKMSALLVDFSTRHFSMDWLPSIVEVLSKISEI